MKAKVFFAPIKPGMLHFMSADSQNTGGAILYEHGKFRPSFEDWFKGFHFMQTLIPIPSASDDVLFDTLEQAQEYVTGKYQEIINSFMPELFQEKG